MPGLGVALRDGREVFVYRLGAFRASSQPGRRRGDVEAFSRLQDEPASFRRYRLHPFRRLGREELDKLRLIVARRGKHFEEPREVSQRKLVNENFFGFSVAEFNGHFRAAEQAAKFVGFGPGWR